MKRLLLTMSFFNREMQYRIKMHFLSVHILMFLLIQIFIYALVSTFPQLNLNRE